MNLRDRIYIIIKSGQYNHNPGLDNYCTICKRCFWQSQALTVSFDTQFETRHNLEDGFVFF